MPEREGNDPATGGTSASSSAGSGAGSRPGSADGFVAGDRLRPAVRTVGLEELARLELDQELTCFRPPSEQKKALLGVASLATHRIVVACDEELIIGYAAVHPPDVRSRWGENGFSWLLELGAIEVAPRFRREGIGKSLLAAIFGDGRLEDKIVIALALWWHWDLRRTGLNLWTYQDMLTRLLGTCGLRKEPTSDREVISHPANSLFARRGVLVESWQEEEFVRLCRRPESN